jgi:hypothetical protein
MPEWEVSIIGHTTLMEIWILDTTAASLAHGLGQEI